MSSINEALRRSRREKTAPGSAVPTGLIAPGPAAARSKAPVIWIAAAAALVGIAAVLYFGSAGPLKSRADKPAAAPPPTASVGLEKEKPPPAPVVETETVPDPSTKGRASVSPPVGTVSEAGAPATSSAGPEASAAIEKEIPARAEKEISPAAPRSKTIRYGSVRRPRREAPAESQAEHQVTPQAAPQAAPPAAPAKAAPVKAASAKAEPVDPSKSEQAVLHFNNGQTAQREGRYDEAVAEYRQALRVNPNLTQAYLNLGNIYFHHQQLLDKGREMYNQVLAVDPDNKFGHNNLGVIFLKQGLLDRAEAEFRAALKTDQGFVDALYNMACVSARQGFNDRAMSHLRLAAGHNPEVRRWAGDDWDLKSLRELPEFQGFVGRPVKND